MDVHAKLGLVYILTNPCLDGWIKIGRTSNAIEQRLAELNQPTNLPLSFRAYAVYHTHEPEKLERSIHNIFDLINKELHASETVNGRLRQREFFKFSPHDAYSVFKEIAKLRGDEDYLKLVELNDEQEEEEAIQRGERARPFRFSMVDINVGDEIEHINDSSIRCTVIDNRKVRYQGEIYSLSALAEKIENRTGLAGPWFFKFDGETLAQRRQRMIGDYKNI
ncbi:MAG: GIY-YIG nuclease family protein [Oscillospiraceae bacterium]|nr:GIY-YIG nuclease family protein [Oscillospiraceae bacterium]